MDVNGVPLFFSTLDYSQIHSPLQERREGTPRGVVFPAEQGGETWKKFAYYFAKTANLEEFPLKRKKIL